jgi:hypothetical protein
MGEKVCMVRLQTFFGAFWGSLGSPSFYALLTKMPFRYSFKYFLVFIFLYGLFGTMVLFLRNTVALPQLLVSQTQGSFANEPLFKKNPLALPPYRLQNQLEPQTMADPAQRLFSLLKIVFPAFVVLTLFSFLVITPLSKLLFLLPFSLFILLLGKIFSLPLSYKKSYQMGLHLLTLPTLLLGLLEALGFAFSYLLAQSLFSAILALIIFRRIKKILVY